jgi:hypothetical protein
MAYSYRDSTEVTFHDNTTSTSKGRPFDVGGFSTLTVEIYGTSSSRKVEFKAISRSGTEIPITGINLNGFNIANNTTGNNEIWQFDITGLDKVIMDVTALSGSGANITVKGRAVV